MDEKELIKKVRNSFKSGATRAKITEILQKSGYKLEYIDVIINKAKKPRKLVFTFIIISVLIIALLITAYSIIMTYKNMNFKDNQTPEENKIINPLENIKVIYGNNNASPTEVKIEDIEITPIFFSYLLTELDAQTLHFNPLTFEDPIIEFEIEEQSFYSTIDGADIDTNYGEHEDSDIIFISDKETIVRAITNENPTEVFKESFQDGSTTLEKIADDTELFAKGYLGLYDELSS